MGVRYLSPTKYAKQFTGNESLSLPIIAGLDWVELTDVPGTPSVSRHFSTRRPSYWSQGTFPGAPLLAHSLSLGCLYVMLLAKCWGKEGGGGLNVSLE